MNYMDRMNKTHEELVTKDSVEICGFWFHIEWRKTMGLDQHGNCWINPENPEPLNKALMNNVLDAYNDIKKKINL